MVSAFRHPRNEVRYCWDQVLRINPLFRISQVFAPPGQGARLLPLYAVFAAIEETCSGHLDEAVAMRKLRWWREEIHGLAARGSEHPILRELAHQGAADELPPHQVEAVFAHAETRLDARPPATLEDLQRQCEEAGRPLVRLELSLTRRDFTNEDAGDDCAAGIGLAQLLRAGRIQSAAAWHWLPLVLLARHGLTRAEVVADPDAPAARPLFDELLESVTGWGPAQQPRPQGEGGVKGADRHLHVMARLQLLGIRRLERAPPSRYADEMTRVGPLQLYQAWRAARRFSRP